MKTRYKMTKAGLRDMCSRAFFLEDLNVDGKIDRGITFSEMMNIWGGYSKINDCRLVGLKKYGWVIIKKQKGGGRYYFSHISKSYRDKWGSFTNPKGILLSNYKDNSEDFKAKPKQLKPKVITKIKEKVIHPKKENVDRDNKRGMQW